MNKYLVDSIYKLVDEIKQNINYVNKNDLLLSLQCSEEQFDSLIENPVYNAAVYLIILEHIDYYMERS